jgi:hypothetical protein
MTAPAATRIEQQLQRQRQMQQEQEHNPYAAPAKGLPPRQDQARPDWTAAETQQRRSANQ